MAKSKPPVADDNPDPMAKSKILIADDNPTNVELMEVYLSDVDCEIAIAVDGLDTLEKVARFHPDLILLDMTMPGMTADETVKAIRALDPMVAILLNSGYTSNDAVKQMLMDGSVQGFLSKPYDSPQLLEAVQGILRISGGCTPSRDSSGHKTAGRPD